MKPMLAAKDPKELRFPCYGSAKIDGIRAVVKDGILLSRTLKPIPNAHTQDLFGADDLEGLDGELAVGSASASDLMQKTTSGVMSEQGEPDVTYWIFDYWTDVHARYSDRILRLQAAVDGRYIDVGSKRPRVRLLPQVLINSAEALLEFEERMLSEGFEGVMTRAPEGVYKYGRSTPREQFLVKHKRWETAEAVVIGFEERMHNANEATTDELGHTKRSSHKDNLVPMGTLGAFLVRDAQGIEFRVSPGVLTHTQRKEIWDSRMKYMGALLTYKTFKVTGVKDKPRFNIFKAWRDPQDSDFLPIPKFLRTHND
jgi:DNA ligase-1